MTPAFTPASLSLMAWATSSMVSAADTSISITVPLPTLAMDRPEFDPTDGYWRGPVWLDQAYFGVAGLRRYGFAEEAEALVGALLSGAEGLLGQAPIYENYDPRTGGGLNAAHFSRSAAHLLMLLESPRP